MRMKMQRELKSINWIYFSRSVPRKDLCEWTHICVQTLMCVMGTEWADLHKQDVNEDFLLFSLTKASDRFKTK